ncbi:MAG: hypothetical protein ABSD44_06855 [Terracidiphilus sp.]
MDGPKDSLIEARGSNAEPIDPLHESLRSLLVIAFFKSRSLSYPFVVGIAQNAERYGIFPVNGKPMHVAVFGRTQADAGRASAVLQYTLGWKGVLLFARGKLIPNGWSILEVINCFNESCSCRDRRAHCHKIIDDPFVDSPRMTNMTISIRLSPEDLEAKPPFKNKKEIDRYIFPCKYLYPRFSFQQGHPSTPQDQIQAGAVRQGCDLCPSFSPEEFKKAGSRTVEEDAFE